MASTVTAASVEFGAETIAVLLYAVREVPRTIASVGAKSLLPTRSYDSFCIPNARCPVCGASVFYFQNSFGSRVFFDELGPPWPKHFCTDNTRWRHSTAVTIEPALDVTPHRTGWLATGWEPLLILDVDGDEILLERLSTGQQFWLKLDKSPPHIAIPLGFFKAGQISLFSVSSEQGEQFQTYKSHRKAKPVSRDERLARKTQAEAELERISKNGDK